MGAFAQLNSLAPILNIQNPPNTCKKKIHYPSFAIHITLNYHLIVLGQALQICTMLGACRLLIVEDSSKDIYQKIILNVSVDDLYYALNN